jgi:cobalt/nickel transport protein
MSRPGNRRPGARFHIGLLVVALIIAGGLSYLASPDPDGLDSVTLSGCQVVEVDGAERLDGACIAQSARTHATAAGPLAGYSLMGGEGTVGLAGVAGVLVTAVLAGGLFWLLRRRDGAVADRAGSEH